MNEIHFVWMGIVRYKYSIITTVFSIVLLNLLQIFVTMVRCSVYRHMDTPYKILERIYVSIKQGSVDWWLSFLVGFDRLLFEKFGVVWDSIYEWMIWVYCYNGCHGNDKGFWTLRVIFLYWISLMNFYCFYLNIRTDVDVSVWMNKWT
jgi:hypothetical protein